eukprot:3953408-Pyramimonas_sp.AAC.1
MAAENRTELAALAPDLQRQRAHFARARTWPPADKPPGDSTRSFSKHPKRCTWRPIPRQARRPRKK